MNARLIVPASVAMALHTILFFGFSRSPVPNGGYIRNFIDLSPKPDNPIKVEWTPPTDVAAAPAASGIPDEARPDLTEPPVKPSSLLIEMPAAPVRPVATQVAVNLTFGPIGRPTGETGDIGSGFPDLTPGQLDSPPRTRSQVAPVYPYEAQISGRKGEVMVAFLVDETGHVQDPHVLRSNDPVFEAPTLRAISKWRFEPGRRGGRVVRFRMAVPVGFSVN